MRTTIFHTAAPIIAALMMVYSVFVLLRGHNEPGGGFIGGLIAASAIAIYGVAVGVGPCRRAMKLDPLTIAGLGVFMAGLAGLPSLGYSVPFLTGLWAYFDIGGAEITLSTPLVFDIGVYLTVLGTIAGIALALEESDAGEDREGGEGGQHG